MVRRKLLNYEYKLIYTNRLIDMLKNEINKYKNIALSNHDIFKILNKKVNIVTYPTLSKIRNINELFGEYPYFILLYMSSHNFGHWIAIIKHNDRIEYFDPYGGNDNFPDEALKNINPEFKKISLQDKPYLTRLLYNTKYPIEYNNYNFQKHGNNIRTCGRHCVVRCLLHHYLLDEYKEILSIIKKDTNMNYDDIVTLMSI